VHLLSWPYLPAASTSFLLGSVVAYKLSTAIVFRQHRLKSRKTEFASFVTIGGFGLLVNGAVIFIGAELLGVHYPITKCVAAGSTFSSNFVLRRQILFVRRAAF
jgi:putative flippase GtrA